MRKHLIILLILFFSSCANKLKVYTIQKISLGNTLAHQEIFLGGFSALLKMPTQDTFLTITDRGPNAEPTNIATTGKSLRPFLLPLFSPRIVEIKLKDHTFEITNQIILKDFQSTPLSGLPNLKSPFDETAIDSRGNILKPDLMGLDSEGLAVDNHGNYWISEEYRPSILKFDRSGRLIRRFIPEDSIPKSIIEKYNKKNKAKVFIEALPKKLNDRKINRGFEGLSLFQNKLFFILQSPLPKDLDSKLDSNLHLDSEKAYVPIFEFDIDSEKIVASYKYEFSNKKMDKIGDLTFYTKNKALVIEQSAQSHRIYMINLHNPDGQSVQKKLLVDLESVGLKGHEKIEGLAIVDETHIAVIIDNDFGICSNLKLDTGTVDLSCNKESILAVVKVEKLY